MKEPSVSKVSKEDFKDFWEPEIDDILDGDPTYYTVDEIIEELNDIGEETGMPVPPKYQIQKYITQVKSNK